MSQNKVGKMVKEISVARPVCLSILSDQAQRINQPGAEQSTLVPDMNS
jgi:hypothetical protein